MRRSLAWLVLGIPALAWATDPLEAGSVTSGGGNHGDLLDHAPTASDDEPQGIINGADATIEDYPMTGGMVMDAYLDMGQLGSGNMRTFVCSSTLIAPDVVLLAGHCLSPEAFTMGFGEMTINEVGWTRQADLTSLDGSNPDAEYPEDIVMADDWVVHPDFDLQTMGMGLSENMDISLMFLSEPILDVPYAYLPSVEEAAQIVVDDEVTIVGWGQQSATSQWEAPPAGTFALKQIATSHLAEVNDFEMQVGAGESDARKCHGDSGGPTFYEVDADTEVKTRLIGVTSHAYDESDCESKGGVDTRVDHYLEWIDNEMRIRCEDGTRAWCDEPGIIPVPKHEDGGGCGCVVAPDPSLAAGWGLGVVALLGLRRRKA